ncbi:clustered with transcription termination protein NusA [Gracilibacillus boraciitolerans JCM 21714]|uniref:Ribosome maturation factor RimP n=1 Tax=Gracilibacillus boraciitolerans JCM 21714 TaxID=1298598 RepID=W4VEI8_9BACI|nr:ribosome maturation factor RimP [Gracilibacillus boraciitolerans]GAE91581.1 clustered with transcription termination protein NusA [Gracilibacillus boraciitolerans JCM 21714]
MTQKIAEKTSDLAKPILDELSLELVEVAFEKEGSNWFLRVYIDKENGIDIEECGHVSEKLSEKLDELDLVSEPYFLEVSSPGVERPLRKEKDFESNIGKNIYVKLYEPIAGVKEFTGVLIDFNAGVASIRYKEKTKQKEVEIPFKKIAKARLAVTFD